MENTLTKNKNEVKLKEPSLYNIVFHNDDFTPFEFVIEILVSIYGKTIEEAVHLATTIHTNTKGVVATYIKSVADMKVLETNNFSKKYEYPLIVEAVEQ
jgi:ATP-dependent Clp protease adaptor protein ClpS